MSRTAGAAHHVLKNVVLAINFFLGADVGGKGSTLSIRQNGSINTWTVTSPDGTVKTLEVNRQESNKY